jgi:hypothetical protein
MSSSKFNYFYRVDVTVAEVAQALETGTTSVRSVNTKTYTFVNKYLRDANSASDRETFIPILKSIGEVTLNSGEFLPTVSFSSITIDDTRGSFGVDRKFSDLLERFTVIDQPITFYIGESENDTDSGGSWTQIGKGQIVSWSRAASSDFPTISFQIIPFKISDRIMNLEVSRDILGMENAPDSSLGRPLPIIFSKPNISQTSQLDRYPQTLPVRISADDASTVKYAVATHMYQTTQARIASNYYIKKTWEDSGDVWASIHFTRAAQDNTASPVGTYYTLNTYQSTAYKLPEVSSTNNETGFLVGGAQFRCRGQGTSGRTSSARLSIFILQVDRTTNTVVSELARGGTALSAYDSLNNVLNNDFSIKINFDAPTVVELTSARIYDFYLGWEVIDYNAALDLLFYKNTGASDRIVKASGDPNTTWRIAADSTGIVAHKLLIVTGVANNHESTYTKDGLTYSSVTFSQTAPDTGQTVPSLDSMEIVLLAEGMDIYGINAWATGTAYPAYSFVSNAGNHYKTINGGVSGATAPTHTSGSASDGGVTWKYLPGGARLITPVDVAEMISYSWNGESWSNVGALDSTSLESSHYDKLFAANQSHRARYLTGIIDAKSTYADVMTEIARGSACKVGVLVSQTLFIHPWGISDDPSFNIPQADIIPLSWEVRASATIINRAQISFQKTYAISEAQATATGFQYSIDYSSDNYLATKQITEISRALFKVQNIVENNFSVFGYSDYYLNVGTPGYLTGGISESQPSDGTNVVYSVDFLADYYISRNAYPATYCSFVVPFHRYKDIKMFDIVTFAHSEFPAFYGTDPNAKPGVVDNGSTVTAVTNAGYGHELTRAKTYRGTVEAVSYVLAMEHAPAIRLTVLVLLNREYDPT